MIRLFFRTPGPIEDYFWRMVENSTDIVRERTHHTADVIVFVEASNVVDIENPRQLIHVVFYAGEPVSEPIPQNMCVTEVMAFAVMGPESIRQQFAAKGCSTACDQAEVVQ